MTAFFEGAQDIGPIPRSYYEAPASAGPRPAAAAVTALAAAAFATLAALW